MYGGCNVASQESVKRGEGKTEKRTRPMGEILSESLSRIGHNTCNFVLDLHLKGSERVQSAM